jgi:CheY-like chemotaxis protein
MKHLILWADDDPDDLETFTELLCCLNGNYELAEFHNGRDLLQHLKATYVTHPPCLIVLDMNMPVLDGRRTLAILKNEEEFNAIPVVVFTTSNNERDKVFCQQFDATFITKPTTYAQLIETVKSLLNLCHH